MISSRIAARLGTTLALGLAVGLPVTGSTLSPRYGQMAPLKQYLEADRNAEVDLARSAAPPSISLHANVLVLTAHGYENASLGTNAFTCLVERSWTSPFDSPDFWNWKLRGPICYNPAASRSVLRYTIFRTEMALAGVSKAHMLERLRAGIEDHQLPPAEAGSMAYMLSRKQYLNDEAKAWYPHLMLYAPSSDGAETGASWGADRRGSPVLFDSSDRVSPEPWALFFVPVPHWSDGSPAPT